MGSCVNPSNNRKRETWILKENMTNLGQSRKEAQSLKNPLVHPKSKVHIGNWNVRTLYQASNASQVSAIMDKLKIDVLGISETHWTGSGKMIIDQNKTILYSGREDDIHREGVGIMISKKAEKALMQWVPVNSRIIQVDSSRNI